MQAKQLTEEAPLFVSSARGRAPSMERGGAQMSTTTRALAGGRG
jgi:hypothetical protein